MKKSLIFIFSLLFLISFISADNNTGNETEQFCTDTDGGMNYYLKGEIEYRNLATGEIQQREDECYDGNSIYEYYCSYVSAGNANAATIDICPNGCENGACVNSTGEINETNQTIEPPINETDDENETENETGEFEYEYERETENATGKYKEKVKIKVKNRLRANYAETSGLPEGCKKTGSAIKCVLADGTRQMIIHAGKSGNIIVQVKGVNMSTKVELYQSNGSVYGIFGNKTKLIKYMPDEIKDRVKAKIKYKIKEGEFDIELDEEGEYNLEYKKQARLLGFIKVHERVRTRINAETGEEIQVKNPWWGFLAKDIEVEEELKEITNNSQ